MPREKLQNEKTEQKAGMIDIPFLVLTLLLLSAGLVMMLSASYASAYYKEGDSLFYFKKEAMHAGIGIVAMIFLAACDYRRLKIFAVPALFATMFLLALVPIMGITVNGAKRWLKLGIQFQPSEFVKFGVILAFSAYASVYPQNMRTFKKGILPCAAVLGIIALLLYKQPHLSCMIIILGTGAILMIAGGSNLLYFTGAGIVGAVGATVMVLTSSHAQKRITTWLDPFTDVKGDGWQIVQSLYAIGSGGLLGVGFGKSRQKFLYIPEAHNDFIFAIICEELGFVGGVIIILLFAMFILRGYWIALHATDRFGALLATGVTSIVAIQTILNVGVVTGVLPVTGVQLPFFSYGGTALTVLLGEIGVVLSVSRYIKVDKEK